MGGRGGSLRSRMHSAKLPALSGSEKQNEWATSVRNLYVEAYNWEKNHDNHDEAYKNRGPVLVERANVLAKKRNPDAGRNKRRIWRRSIMA